MFVGHCILVFFERVVCEPLISSAVAVVILAVCEYEVTHTNRIVPFLNPHRMSVTH